jgi:cysteine desulfurase
MDSTIYFDNAATTQLDKQVLEAMMPYLTTYYGNPSSTYSIGLSTRMAIESSRKTVANLLGVKPATIYFTSGGTESNNTAIAASIRDLACTHIISSSLEHHAVLHTLEYYSKQNDIPVSYVGITSDGHIDYNDLEDHLKKQSGSGHKCLVSLMHANNEIGSLLDIKRVSSLCKKFNAVFHSDCVQTVGHYPLDLLEMGPHFISGASHKFHGPKGIGILYVSEDVQINPLIYGGAQERNLRAGTENVYGIVGFAKALDLAMHHYENDKLYIGSLKNYLKNRLMETIPGVSFNGPEDSLYTVLSVCFPKSPESQMLLLILDMQGICVSGGSACSSGANSGSHVIKTLRKEENCTTIRFSFSKYNTSREIDRLIEVLEASLIVKDTVAV